MLGGVYLSWLTAGVAAFATAANFGAFALLATATIKKVHAFATHIFLWLGTYQYGS